MNILIISCWYPSDENPAQGMFVHEHAKAMTAAGMRVRVLHFNTYPSSDIYRRDVYSEEKDGITVYHVQIHSRFHKAVLLMKNHLENRLVLAMDTILEEFSPDLLHAHVVFQAGILARRMSRIFGIPYVITEHWSGLDWFSKAFYMPVRQARRAYRDAAGVSVVSGFLAGRMREYMRVDRDIEIIPNVVDTELFAPALANDVHVKSSAATAPENEEQVNMLCVTSFGKGRKVTKRPELLVAALALMPDDEKKKYHLTIAGAGEGLEAFKKLVDENNLSSRVVMAGFTPPEKLAEMMRHADVLVHPTEIETFGVVAAEALCCGLPCVVSNRGALPDLITHGANGLLVPDNTPEAWLEAFRNTSSLIMSANKRQISYDMTNRVNILTVGTQWKNWLKSLPLSQYT
ncbi:MAG: glycosyltransferase, partial [Cyclonatronaceae bacterium]